MVDLFLLPFAGGTSLIYDNWKFSKAVNVIALDYKGHGFRMRETLYKSFEEMIGDIHNQILQKRTCSSITIFGHSMGGLVAWDVARNFSEAENNLKIIISACLPPHLFNEKLYSEMATDNWLFNFLIQYSRVDQDRIKSKFFQDKIYPTIRNDYHLISVHKHETINKTLFDIACFYGEDDKLMPQNGMEQWRSYTTQRFLLRKFKGEHFYIEDETNRKELITTIESFIQ